MMDVTMPSAISSEQDAGDGVAVVAYLHTTQFDDDEGFERQRRAIRRALTFDGHNAWRGVLDTSITADLDRWSALVDAATEGAGVHVEGLVPRSPGIHPEHGEA
jgi:hypothetical protein